MSNYNIHIDKPLPPPPQIDSHQNFDQLYGKYRGVKRFEFWRNLYRKPTYFAALVGLMAIGYLVVDSAMKGKEAAFIQPPFDQIQLPLSPVTWEATTPLRHTISPEVTVTVPASAFIDAAGNPISGPVVLQYRELNDPKDWFLAGIPMGYDSAGMHHLQAATMIEVLAYQEGKPVFLKEDKTIEVTYLATDENNRNQYFLDSLEQNWVHTGIDELIELEAAVNSIPPKPTRPALLAVRDQETDTLLTPKAFELPPQKPGKPFKVSIKNLSDFPEMKGYEDVYWEKIKDSHANDPNREQIRWGSATLRRTRGVYELTFSRQEKGATVKRVVYGRPMFRASSAQEAQRIYRDQYAAYQEAELAYEARKAAAVANSERDDAAESERLAAEQAYLAELAAWKAQYEGDDATVPSRFKRRLLLNRLGIHASGQASPLLQGPEIHIELPIAEDKGATSLIGSTLYFTLQTGGSLLEVPVNEAGTFSLPCSLAVIDHAWLMMETGTFAIVEVSDTDEALPAKWVPAPESLAGFRTLWK